ncbi:iron-containing alcohol dehydrogenase [Leucobacter massiliensis]|uniref:Alcohol dehydrogenase n=1 Tax=Leucobacter massiliensis TaxID=1686285 RepID=A0A2S9QM83_9MICO|nr:iron-containing alcohol dehydrogenase [Leucobacter massiliensis]PRI10709.1 alcohol dehydrogenase [Leucobacter massiliensis]
MVHRISVPPVLRIGGGALAELPDTVRGLRASRAVIVTDAFLSGTGVAADIARALDAAGVPATVFDETVPDPTTASLEAGIRAVADHDADVVVGLGGGSAIDSAKALAVLAVRGGAMRELKAPVQYDGAALPVIAIPTTAGTGSEATQFTVITDSASGEKMLCGGPAYLPSAAIVDYELTLSMPPRLTADTGLDALTHAVEAYVSSRASGFSDALALQAIRQIGGSLRRAYADGGDAGARESMMEAATLAGIAFSNSSVALVHGMSRPLGARFRIAHGMANAMLFAAVTEFSLGAADARYADCARALGVAGEQDADAEAARALVTELHRLRAELAVPAPADFGIAPDDWEAALRTMAEQALASGSPANNPRVPSRGEIEELYRRIYAQAA